MSKQKLMLYSLKKQPDDLLKGVMDVCSKTSVVVKAYFCMGSLLENSSIIEKKIIGFEVSADASNEHLSKLGTLCNELTKKYEDLMFTTVDVEPFKSHFTKEKPFYMV